MKGMTKVRHIYTHSWSQLPTKRSARYEYDPTPGKDTWYIRRSMTYTYVPGTWYVGVSSSYLVLAGTWYFPFIFIFNHHFHFPAQLVGGFTPSDLLDKPWSQVVPSPRYVPSIFIAHRLQHSHCSSIIIQCC